MKLIFRKNEEEEISVFMAQGSDERPFSYTHMVNALIKTHGMEAPEAVGDFTEEELKSINSMVERINLALNDDEDADFQPVDEPN